MKREIPKAGQSVCLLLTLWFFLNEGILAGPIAQGGVFPLSPFLLTTTYGTASWYAESDPYVQPLTASGEKFHDDSYTCASWYYPFNTLLIVTNLQNSKQVICRVNDRGPSKRLNRLIDLSIASFEKLDCAEQGLIPVSIEPLWSL